MEVGKYKELKLSPTVRKCLDYLDQKYPDAIFKNPHKTRPLTDDALARILEEQSGRFGEEVLNKALHAYTNSRSYVVALSQRNFEISTDGTEIAQPSEQKIIDAEAWLKKNDLKAILDEIETGVRTPEREMELVAILSNDRRELISQSGFVSKGPFQDTALELRERLVSVTDGIARLTDSDYDRRDLLVAVYYRCLSSCFVSVFNADFETARTSINEATEAAYGLAGKIKLFPNVFFDRQELVSTSTYLNAMESFYKRRYGQAVAEFNKLLGEIEHLRGLSSSYDSHRLHYKICQALDAFFSESAPTDKLVNEIFNALKNSRRRIARTVYLLAEPLRIIQRFDQRTIISERELNAVREDLAGELDRKWYFISLWAPIHGQARRKQAGNRLAPPRFFQLGASNAFEPETWAAHFSFILRCAVLTALEFDYRRYEPEKSVENIRSLEQCTLVQLMTKLEDWMQVSGRYGNLDTVELQKLCADYVSAIEANDKVKSLSLADAFLDALPPPPHLVRVLEVIKGIGDDPTSRPNLINYRVERLWNEAPSEARVLTETELEADQIAAMRVKYGRNKSKFFNLAKAADPIEPSLIGDMLWVYEQWSEYTGPVEQKRFLKWFSQFTEYESALAIRLLKNFRFYSERDVRTAWQDLFSKSIPQPIRLFGARVVGIGDSSKSGNLQKYYFRQSLSHLSKALKLELDENATFNSDQSRIYIDDFLGTGSTIERFLDMEIENRRLPKAPTVVAVVAGLENSVALLREKYEEHGVEFYCWDNIPESDRAFSWDSKIWSDDSDRQRARKAMKELGQAILGAESHSLGWEGSEALVAFHHNTPNNTLPIFWMNGGPRNWHPLFERLE